MLNACTSKNKCPKTKGCGCTELATITDHKLRFLYKRCMYACKESSYTEKAGAITATSRSICEAM